MKDLTPINAPWTPPTDALANLIRGHIRHFKEKSGLTNAEAEDVLGEIMHEMDVYDEAQTNRGREATVGGQ